MVGCNMPQITQHGGIGQSGHGSARYNIYRSRVLVHIGQSIWCQLKTSILDLGWMCLLAWVSSTFRLCYLDLSLASMLFKIYFMNVMCCCCFPPGCRRLLERRRSWTVPARKFRPGVALVRTLRCSNQDICNRRKKEGTGTREKSRTLGIPGESLFIRKRQGHFWNEKLLVGLVRSDRAEDPIMRVVKRSFRLYRMSTPL